MDDIILQGDIVLNEQKDRYRRLGRNIARYRKFRDLTQDDLADLLNVSRAHLARVEIAEASISLDLVFRICDALDVSPKDLFDFE